MSSDEWHSLKQGRDSGRCSQQPKHRWLRSATREETLKQVPFVLSDRGGDK